MSKEYILWRRKVPGHPRERFNAHSAWYNIQINIYVFDTTRKAFALFQGPVRHESAVSPSQVPLDCGCSAWGRSGFDRTVFLLSIKSVFIILLSTYSSLQCSIRCVVRTRIETDGRQLVLGRFFAAEDAHDRPDSSHIPAASIPCTSKQTEK